eukprot:Selendium_serpulae@DN6374_c1_g2_i13.p2
MVQCATCYLRRSIRYLRSQMGLVSQEPVLFHDTIMNNIRAGKPDATDVRHFAHHECRQPSVSQSICWQCMRKSFILISVVRFQASVSSDAKCSPLRAPRCD